MLPGAMVRTLPGEPDAAAPRPGPDPAPSRPGTSGAVPCTAAGGGQPGGPPGERAGSGEGAPSDAALVERARGGDAAAFRALVERHQDRAYAVALRITRSPTEAAEEGSSPGNCSIPSFTGKEWCRWMKTARPR